MKLPNYDKCIISERKITDYLLSEKHPLGRTKARFFMHLGYSHENWKVFASELKTIAESNEVTKIELSPFGRRYVVDGRLKNVYGKEFDLRTIWFIDNESDIPHFVTAYPKKA